MNFYVQKKSNSKSNRLYSFSATGYVDLAANNGYYTIPYFPSSPNNLHFGKRLAGSPERVCNNAQ